LTAESVRTDADAWRVVFAYMRRWQIELTWLCWLLVASVGELDVSIASLLLFFDIQYAKWSEDFPCYSIPRQFSCEGLSP